MSAKAIYEYQAKELIEKHVNDEAVAVSLRALFQDGDSWASLQQSQPWLATEGQMLVAKPDQLIKRRGKLGLVKAGENLDSIKQWIGSHQGREFNIGLTVGILRRFIIEPFVKHDPNDEVYVCIYSHREGDSILFYHEGGVDVGDVDSKASRFQVDLDSEPQEEQLRDTLLSGMAASGASDETLRILSRFICHLYQCYVKLHFTYLEINPLVVRDNKLYILDVAARLDQCAEFLCKDMWGDVEFPVPFGREALPEEAYIAAMDAKSGASLKLTVLNPQGRIWTMVAGGGASVIYADTICDMGGASELANYGEYSGAPSESQTYEYAKTLLTLMTRFKHSNGKVLIIGGGIANFTNVAATFKGIVGALREFQTQLIEHQCTIFVRRAGPNYQEGLRVMRELSENLGVPIHVFGPETHMTAVVGMALGCKEIPKRPAAMQQLTTANFLLPGATSAPSPAPSRRVSQFDLRSRSTSDATGGTNLLQAVAERLGEEIRSRDSSDGIASQYSRPLFTAQTKSVVWGMQQRAVQSMLDFDFVCSRKEPSVVAMIYPFVGDHKQKFYWGHKEILIPVYKLMSDCFEKHPDADVLISFASLRSAYDSTVETLGFKQIRVIAIIAEGIPENQTRRINRLAKSKNVTIIGPATVGGVKPGCFKIGNTGGMMDNILSSRLYRPGSVSYVSRSGGMSNELNNILALNTNGVREGVAIGGDRYPGTTFMDHILRYEADDETKLLVVLGEVGGVEEYELARAVQNGVITKPVVAWCIGTCASMFTSEVQFGHAGACANAQEETAAAKNEALRAAGVFVPASFDELGEEVHRVYCDLVNSGVIIEKEESAPPTVPMDFSWARELGLIRKPSSFMTSICDERGSELLYAGIPITDIIHRDFGVGGVLSLLWFQRALPKYAGKFIELCLIVTADHGPAVSGAHNTIVCARAGKDLVSCLTSGLLTIGDRFGGALDGAAKHFSTAYDSGQSPMQFVNSMRKKGELIMGIGHRVKSLNNPDMRTEILKKFAKDNFPKTLLLDYALQVEQITTSKKPNLILNVDGVIGVAMVDLLRHCDCFTREEANEFIEIGTLNALFVLGRSMGFIGHYLDQRRLKQGLYRHPWDDISYVLPEQNSNM